MAHGDEEVLREFFSRAAYAPASAERMVDAGHVVEKVVLHELDVGDVPHVDHTRAACGGKGNGARRVLLHRAESSPHAHGKVAVANRLDHEVERVHLIALYSVLGEVRHENERGGGVLLAQHLCRLHAVDARQDDVHEDEVDCVGGREVKGGCKAGHQEADSVLRGKALEVRRERACRLVVILDNQHLVCVHAAHLDSDSVPAVTDLVTLCLFQA